MLDAVAAVQRRSPRFLISERVPPEDWARVGVLYLCRSPRTAAEVDNLGKYPARADHRWAGIVCFRGTAPFGTSEASFLPWISEKGDHRRIYRDFAVFGDPDELREVEKILATDGFRRID